MGRESSGDPSAAAHSSIALLQERFRQLQRVKEMREEREHLRAFAESERRRPSSGREQRPKWFLHPDLVHPSRPLRAEPGAEFAGFPACGGSASVGLWPDRPAARGGVGGHDEMDVVDTSLHL